LGFLSGTTGFKKFLGGSKIDFFGSELYELSPVLPSFDFYNDFVNFKFLKAFCYGVIFSFRAVDV
jgi:hypothetical protein